MEGNITIISDERWMMGDVKAEMWITSSHILLAILVKGALERFAWVGPK